ncbi:hypothetical protein QTO01_03075 [Vibrio mytili]|uniref:hypothetical protein n=1 Tax=Vibrio mytili TaxID=50718 RepID=UPI002F424E65
MRSCIYCGDGTPSLLTKRKNAYVYQCQSCFGQVGTPIKKQEALQIFSNLPAFIETDEHDTSLNEELERYYFKSEPQLCEWFIERFSEWFYIFTEVHGNHTAEHENLRIDFILYPKEQLVEQGFHRSYFGVEVKHFLPSQGHGRKPSRAIWQTASYNDTLFDLQSSKSIPKNVIKRELPRAVKLNYSLIFSNISFEKEYREYFGLKEQFESSADERAWKAMLLVANHANVGTVTVKTSDYSKIKRWEFSFAGSYYFTYTLQNDTPLKVHDMNLVTKKRTGNF